MSMFPGGWRDLSNKMPIDPANFILSAKLGITFGTSLDSSSFATPTGGSWASSLLVISSEPSVSAVNSTAFPDQAMIANGLNMQTVIAKTSGAPPYMSGILFFYGNLPGEAKWQMDIPINFGANTYTTVQIGLLENLAGRGDEHNLYPVIDFGNAGFTAQQTLTIVFSGYYGPLDLVLRLEDTVHSSSSIFEMRCIVMPVSFSNDDLTLEEKQVYDQNRRLPDIHGNFIRYYIPRWVTRLDKFCNYIWKGMTKDMKNPFHPYDYKEHMGTDVGVER